MPGRNGRSSALQSGKRLLPGIVRMVAFRAGIRLTLAVASANGVKQRPNRTLAALFQSASDIIPNPERVILQAGELRSIKSARDAAIKGSLGDLNQTQTLFPWNQPANGL